MAAPALERFLKPLKPFLNHVEKPFLGSVWISVVMPHKADQSCEASEGCSTPVSAQVLQFSSQLLLPISMVCGWDAVFLFAVSAILYPILRYCTPIW